MLSAWTIKVILLVFRVDVLYIATLAVWGYYELFLISSSYATFELVAEI